MPERKRLPDERASVVKKIQFGEELKLYLIVGLYEDGSPGEIIIRGLREGSRSGGLLNAFARVFSTSLQFGVPLEDLVSSISHLRFEPMGMTGDAKTPFAFSVMDYIGRYLERKFLPAEEEECSTSES